MEIETYTAEGSVLCYVVRAERQFTKTNFVTDCKANFQLGFIVYPQGHLIPKHQHTPIERNVVGTSEFLLVRRGRVQLDIYDMARKPVASTILERGDAMLMLSGGHGFKMLEDSELLEVKQGPYPGMQEKVRFE